MPKLTVTIELTKDGFKVTIPGIQLEQKCHPDQAAEIARLKAMGLLLDAVEVLQGFKKP